MKKIPIYAAVFHFVFIWMLLLNLRGTYTEASNCPAGSINHILETGEPICYWEITTAQNVYESESRCNQDGGVLAYIPDINASSVVRQLIRNSKMPLHYIGYTERLRNVTIRGSNISQEWSNLRPNQGIVDLEECVAVDPNLNWYDVTCSIDYPIVCSNFTRCSTDLRQPCPPSSRHHTLPDGQPICYWLVTTYQNVTESENICNRNGGHLAYIPDETATEVIRQLQTENDLYWSDKVFYVGYTEIDTVVYVRGTNYTQNWTYWQKTEPNRDVDTCVFMKNSAWYDTECTNKFMAVCSDYSPNPKVLTNLTGPFCANYDEITSTTLHTTTHSESTIVTDESSTTSTTEGGPTIEREPPTKPAVVAGILVAVIALIVSCIVIYVVVVKRRRLGSATKSNGLDMTLTT